MTLYHITIEKGGGGVYTNSVSTGVFLLWGKITMSVDFN